MRTTKIYNYMKSRAKAEKMGFDLDVPFFEGYFMAGIRNFFGVELDNKGNLLEDWQNPKFFKKYNTLNK